MKKEGGIETLLFGPDKGPRESRRNSAVMSGKVQTGPDKRTANMSKSDQAVGGDERERERERERIEATTEVTETVRDTGRGKKSGIVKSVQNTKSTTDSHPKESVKIQSSSSSRCRGSGIIDADGEGDRDGDTIIIDNKSAPADSGPSLPLPRFSDTSEDSIMDHISLSDSGPFREKRRGVHFSETLGDGDWENICIDATPFTIVPTEEGYGFAQGLEEKSMLKDATLNLTLPSEGKVSVKEGEAIARTASANAEQIFCDEMSSSLFSSNSPLESESDKVKDSK